jgi:septal ring factor EnvC (AmiA/AmiB activator)
MMNKLTNELKSAQDEHDKLEHQLKDTDKTINALKLGVRSIYNRIGCDHEGLTNLLGTHGVTESNMLQYLGIIEQRTNELLTMYVDSQTKGGYDAQQELK